ncbi:MAG TPA: OmpW family outer membrane protein [Pseudomonadales bacterium]|nr:OmpW family outer membrane protein [Pseudomonadales bacterium]
MRAIQILVSASVMCMGFVMGAQAYEAGDFIVRAGTVTVAPNTSASTPELNGNNLYGANVDVKSDTQLGLTAVYMLTPEIGLELLAATPLTHDIRGDKTAASYLGTSNLGSTKELPPTLSVQYYFNNSSALTPYVGLGVNYTKFWNEDAGSQLNATLGGDVDLSLDNSRGLAAEGGVDFNLGNNWLLNASVWYIDIDTNATYTVKNGALASARVKSDVSLDPWVYMASVGYKL